MNDYRWTGFGIGAVLLFITPFLMAQESPFPDYRIGASDAISITVWGQDNLDRTLVVRPDGMVSYPLIGDIDVVGMTPLALRDHLAERLAEYVNVLPSEVTVSVDEVNSYTVSVLGEVNLPGRYAFQSRVTVLDVLAEAGGVTSFAKERNVVILRNENGEVRRIPFDYRRVSRRNRPQEMVFALPGDIIMVP